MMSFHRKKHKHGVLRCVVFFIVCVVSLGLTVYTSVQHVQLAFNGIKADATAVRVEEVVGIEP